VIALLALGAALLALGEDKGARPVNAVPSQRVVQIQADELWVSPTQHLEGGLVVVVDGRVRIVGSAEDADPTQPILRHKGIVTAGMIACRTQLGTRDELQDDTRSVMPAARAIDAIDPLHHDFRRALAAGITTVGIAPGPENLVGGVACAVKTAGGRVVAPETALALSLSADALGRSTARAGFRFGAAEEPGRARPDGGPENSARTQRGTREPTSYAGALEKLDELFAHRERADLPVTIEAWDRHEVLRAVAFARAHGLSGAIRGAPLAGDQEVLSALHDSGLGVVVGPYSILQSRPSLESLAALSEAGIPVGFALDAPEDSSEELRIGAARALGAGASREAVWKALTVDAALLTGVADHVGEIKPGLDADLVLWSGDPLDLSSHVVAVFVDGVRAWPEPAGH